MKYERIQQILEDLFRWGEVDFMGCTVIAIDGGFQWRRGEFLGLERDVFDAVWAGVSCGH